MENKTIDLRTNPNLSKVFNFVLNHLISQGSQSSQLLDGTDTCVYREANSNKMCAIGALIPDELYSNVIEASAIEELLVLEPLCRDLCELDQYIQDHMKVNKYFFIAIQSAHDNPLNWGAEGFNETGLKSMLDLAISFHLELPLRLQEFAAHERAALP
jgi:hypothetical protein